jgi:hypothetical protein
MLFAILCMHSHDKTFVGKKMQKGLIKYIGRLLFFHRLPLHRPNRERT